MSYKILKIYDVVQTDPRLNTLQERLVVNHILFFQNNGQCCMSSNNYIAYFLACNEFKAQEVLNALASRGIIKLWYPSASNKRMLSVILPGDEQMDCESLNDIFNLTEEF